MSTPAPFGTPTRAAEPDAGGPRYLLTYQGTLLCAARDGTLVQCPVTDEAAPPVTLPADMRPMRFEQFLSAEGLSVDMAMATPALAGFTAGSTDGGRTLTLRKQGKYLTAEDDRQSVAHTRATASLWEYFAPIGQRDLSLLRGLAANRWLIRSTGAIVEPGEAAFGAGFALQMGGIAVDLRYQLPFEGRMLPYRIGLLREGWRIDEACMLRPLVVMTAFRAPAIHEQVLLSLRSLRAVAGYSGQVLLLTDLPRDRLDAALGGEFGRSTTVITMEVADKVGEAAARYALLDWPHARHFQPILCVDPDILFDADVAPLLAAIAASGRLAAPVENQSLLRSSPEVGASLLQQDGPLPRLAAGFSTAALGIPNLVEHRDTLAQIRRVMVNRSERFGRNEPEWLEQEVANYVCHRLADADTHLMARFVRTHPASRADAVTRGAGLLRLDAGRGTQAQADAMRAALAALTGEPPHPVAACADAEHLGDEPDAEPGDLTGAASGDTSDAEFGDELEEPVL